MRSVDGISTAAALVESSIARIGLSGSLSEADESLILMRQRVARFRSGKEQSLDAVCIDTAYRSHSRRGAVRSVSRRSEPDHREFSK